MAWHIDLQLANKEDLEKIGKQSQGQRTDLLSDSDKKSPHDTRKEIAKAANTSTGMVAMADVVRKKAPELWEKAKRDEVTVSAAYKTVKKKEDIQKRAEAVKAQTLEESKAMPARIHLADALDWLQEVGPFDLLLTDPPL